MGTEPRQDISRGDFLKLVAASTAALALDWRRTEAVAAEVTRGSSGPVVVIGGGLGGLSAAATLARRGVPVTLVEQHIKPGGYATTFERADGKFTFDVSLHATSAARGGLYQMLEAAGVQDQVQTVELPELCRIITPDHEFVWPQRDPDAIVEQLVQVFPEEQEGIRSFFDYLMGIMDEAMKEFNRNSWWARLAFPFTHRKMWGVRNMTFGDVLDDHVQDPRVRSVLSSFWGYYGLPPSRLSGFYYCIATASYIRFGGHYVTRRSQDLSDALMAAIEANGGQVLLGTRATAITAEGGAVTGVTTADGHYLDATAVISNASVPGTLRLLRDGTDPGALGEAAEEYFQRLESFRPSLSTFLVWLGLNQELRGRVEGYEFFVQNGYDPERAYQAALACDPTECDLGVTIYDNAYEGYSSPGTSTVALIMLSGYEPWRRFEADYLAGRKEGYLSEKERIAQALIDRAEERVVPGLRSMIEVVEAATPLTNLRYTRNPEGAIYGYEQVLDNAYMKRLPMTTPIAGLYYASAWTNPGGGYQPCLQAGMDAALALLGD
ncbi:MAG TPA: NAD(P)/FAD-dependent oxidoreductase [Gemmatimonadota bacterium]|nr:NAD(P)/FAD-dependent oxidoreductase [Gemmatimonadota bacterium]